MSFGYGANYAYVLNEDKIKELNLPTWDAFKKALDNCEDINDYLYSFDPEGPIEDEDSAAYLELHKLHQQVDEEFTKATGLTFDLAYHDSDSNGSCYDDVNEVFFTVWGVERLTASGEEAVDSKLISKAFWVTGG